MKSNINIPYFCRLSCDGKNVREEPKAIVFLSKILLLFQYCHLCFATNPSLNVLQTGTMLTIESSCSSCKGMFKWDSQPHMLGKFPAGNLLLSFATCVQEHLSTKFSWFLGIWVCLYTVHQHITTIRGTFFSQPLLSIGAHTKRRFCSH